MSCLPVSDVRVVCLFLFAWIQPGLGLRGLFLFPVSDVHLVCLCLLRVCVASVACVLLRRVSVDVFLWFSLMADGLLK